jgi:hypothetical protein
MSVKGVGADGVEGEQSATRPTLEMREAVGAITPLPARVKKAQTIKEAQYG